MMVKWACKQGYSVQDNYNVNMIMYDNGYGEGGNSVNGDRGKSQDLWKQTIPRQIQMKVEWVDGRGGHDRSRITSFCEGADQNPNDL